MSSISPNSEIYLIKAPLESDNLNQLNFANQTAQVNYFKSLPKIALEKYTYIRQNSAINVEGNADDLMRYNYMMYKNTSYGNKWIFAFITNVTFLANSVTQIQFRTDVFNTWYFDVTFKPSYIEREHTNNDAIGANVLNEDTSEGEYVCNAGTEIPILDMTQGYWIGVQCSDAPTEVKSQLDTEARVYGGVQQGSWLFLIDGVGAGAAANFDNMVEWFTAEGKIDAIISMFIVPRAFAPNAQDITVQDPNYSFVMSKLPKSTTAYATTNQSVSMNTTLDGYTPRNNRLYCYPYNYIKLSNHAGADTVLKWEEFYTNDHHAEFYVHAVPNQGIDSRIIPKYYKMNSTNIHAFYDYGLTGGKLPCVSWKSDYYLNWQATNGINIASNGTKYVQETMNSNLFGNPVIQPSEGASNATQDTMSLFGRFAKATESGLAGVSAAGQAFKAFASNLAGAGYRASLTPDTVQGTQNIGDLSFAERMNTFSVQKMSIRANMAALIDQHFDMFGYKCLKIKTPNINGRTNWNYVKTINCNITGDIPQVDMQELKAIFNNGVTIWHNPNTYLDYSQSNAII